MYFAHFFVFALVMIQAAFSLFPLYEFQQSESYFSSFEAALYYQHGLDTAEYWCYTPQAVVQCSVCLSAARFSTTPLAMGPQLHASCKQREAITNAAAQSRP